MVGAPALRIHTITTGVVCYDQAHKSSRLCCQFLNLRRILNQQHHFLRRISRSKSSNLCLAVISCNTNNNSDYNSHPQDAGHDFILASLLLSETVRHHHLRTHGFQEEIRWQSSNKSPPFSIQGRKPRADSNFIGPGFLQRFQSPTIFLKISCDEDFLLPIVVGEFAVQKLIESSQEDYNGDNPNHFQLARQIVGKLGYDVKMIKITERVVNTYFAGIYFQKPGKSEILRVDARPSDAINVAQRCKVPIYVNKQVVLNDAIKIDYAGRIRDTKSIYDVTLDSAADGPDLLLEELDMVKNLNLAVKQERYSDAATWRDKLMKHRDLRNEH
ncbi:Bifunctional nuclease [Heracleum sosnowskyi]|uniref:Bifunctional nuclease n=1 Tax=Heracleum sosnowskyi TaxID=360622 RepID=A0AAD8HTH6_9APIA|nr:Bifunctional nuclease [Heracleum sosnowskyi]